MREAAHAMKSLLPFAAAAIITLAACNQTKQPQVIDANPDPMATQLANAAPVELPPAITGDKTFRCKDQSLAYVTFFQGDKQVVVRTEQNGTATTLKAPEAGQPFTAEGGWSLKGDQQNITLKTPTKPSLTCHV
jgi:hypothetical protein